MFKTGFVIAVAFLLLLFFRTDLWPASIEFLWNCKVSTTSKQITQIMDGFSQCS